MRRRTLSCFSCPTRERCEFKVLEQEELELLNRIKVCNTYQPGQVVFYQDNPCLGIYCISSGTLALRRTDPMGNSMLLRLAHRDQTLGYRTHFSGGAYSCSAEAINRCQVCFVDRAGFAGLLEANPSLARSFLTRLARDQRGAEEARMNLATLSVRARMAHLLLMLRERFASVTDDGCLSYELPLSRKDMASIVGTRPETVTRVIRSLEADGVTRFKGRRVIVPDLDLLFDEVEPLDRVA